MSYHQSFVKLCQLRFGNQPHSLPFFISSSGTNMLTSGEKKTEKHIKFFSFYFFLLPSHLKMKLGKREEKNWETFPKKMNVVSCSLSPEIVWFTTCSYHHPCSVLFFCSEQVAETCMWSNSKKEKREPPSSCLVVVQLFPFSPSSVSSHCATTIH